MRGGPESNSKGAVRHLQGLRRSPRVIAILIGQPQRFDAELAIDMGVFSEWRPINKVQWNDPRKVWHPLSVPNKLLLGPVAAQRIKASVPPLSTQAILHMNSCNATLCHGFKLKSGHPSAGETHQITKQGPSFHQYIVRILKWVRTCKHVLPSLVCPVLEFMAWFICCGQR